jgi:hypothetical protein
MQDLGKITIDINEGGGSSAGGAPSGASGGSGGGGGINIQAIMSAAASALSFVASVVKKAFDEVAKAARYIYDSLMRLHSFIMGFADDIREYSPAIQLAEMGNELEMMAKKMRMSAVTSPFIAAQMVQSGRVERAMLEIRGFTASLGAIFLEPITKAVADILENIVVRLPEIIEAIYEAAKSGGSMSMKFGQALVENHAIFGVGGMTLGAWLIQFGAAAINISKGVKKLADRADAEMSLSDLNKPFLNDLRLMGARI